MDLIVIALVAGVIIGASGFIPAAALKHVDKLTTITLFIMLAALGAQIGSNNELLGNLAALGWRALVIALLSVAGSVTVLWLAVRYFKLATVEEEGD